MSNFQTSNVNQRRPLAIHQRGLRVAEPYARANVRLLPRAVFAGHPEVLRAYDKQSALLNAIDHHSSEVRRLRRESEAAAESYRLAIREALSSGKDTTKIQNLAPDLDVHVQEHLALLRRAQQAAEAHGRQLGKDIQAAAPLTFEAVEKRLGIADAKVRKAVAELVEAMHEWGSEWQVRFILSAIATFGGPLSSHEPEQATPKEVHAALALIIDQLANVDRLKADEAQLAAERAKDARAQAQLASGVRHA